MTVAVPSTPASYFHLLRRHALDGIRRPLVVFTPEVDAAQQGRGQRTSRTSPTGKFRSVFDEPAYESGVGDRDKVKRVLLVSGKLYYELAGEEAQGQARRHRDRADRAALPGAEASACNETLDRYPNATEFPWVQEEPANQGAWPFFGLALPEIFCPTRLTGIAASRVVPMSAPSSGSSKVHAVEQQEIVDEALDRLSV